ncbi:MAG TPA: YceI family protein [Polyangiaceae bacterium]|nr:YceI family protein [Polyangiaceae bacterium]
MAKQEWTFDTAHSVIGFAVRHLMVTKVRGTFKKWSGKLELDEDDLSLSRVRIELDSASIDTQESQRDGHLRSADFFDVAAFPSITFASTRIERAGDDRYRLSGDLSIRGVTRPVVLEVEDGGRAKHPMVGDMRAGFSVRGSILRSDFGLTWNAVLETGGVAVSDKVELDLEIQAFRA